MNSEAKPRSASLDTSSQKNSCSPDRPTGGANSIQSARPVSGAPTIISGRRRPNLERTLSEMEPISGSMIESTIMEMASATPTTLPERPRTAV